MFALPFDPLLRSEPLFSTPNKQPQQSAVPDVPASSTLQVGDSSLKEKLKCENGLSEELTQAVLGTLKKENLECLYNSPHFRSEDVYKILLFLCERASKIRCQDYTILKLATALIKRYPASVTPLLIEQLSLTIFKALLPKKLQVYNIVKAALAGLEPLSFSSDFLKGSLYYGSWLNLLQELTSLPTFVSLLKRPQLEQLLIEAAPISGNTGETPFSVIITPFILAHLIGTHEPISAQAQAVVANWVINSSPMRGEYYFAPTLKLATQGVLRSGFKEDEGVVQWIEFVLRKRSTSTEGNGIILRYIKPLQDYPQAHRLLLEKAFTLKYPYECPNYAALLAIPYCLKGDAEVWKQFHVLLPSFFQSDPDGAYYALAEIQARTSSGPESRDILQQTHAGIYSCLQAALQQTNAKIIFDWAHLASENLRLSANRSQLEKGLLQKSLDLFSLFPTSLLEKLKNRIRFGNYLEKFLTLSVEPLHFPKKGALMDRLCQGPETTLTWFKELIIKHQLASFPILAALLPPFCQRIEKFSQESVELLKQIPQGLSDVLQGSFGTVGINSDILSALAGMADLAKNFSHSFKWKFSIDLKEGNYSPAQIAQYIHHLGLLARIGCLEASPLWEIQLQQLFKKPVFFNLEQKVLVNFGIREMHEARLLSAKFRSPNSFHMLRFLQLREVNAKLKG